MAGRRKFLRNLRTASNYFFYGEGFGVLASLKYTRKDVPLLRGRLIGRTPDFESGYRGSSPRPGAIFYLLLKIQNF
jgi:hypothetical protein